MSDAPFAEAERSRAGDDTEHGDLIPLGAVLPELDKVTREAAHETAMRLVGTTRAPPANLDAERALLGGLLLDPSALDDAIAEGLVAGDFYRRQHGIIYGAVVDLREAGEPVDALTVVEHLNAKGLLDVVGGASAVSQLEALIPTSAHVGAYARVVSDHAERRRLADALQGSLVDVLAHRSLDDVRAHLRGVVEGGDAAPRGRRSPATRRALADVRAALGAGVGEHGGLEFMSGDELLALDFPATQWVVDGLIPEAGVVAIAGEPKTMKTWVAMELAVAIASGGLAFGEFRARGPRPVVMVLAESTRRETQNRLRAVIAGAGREAKGAAGFIRVANLAALNVTDEGALAELVAQVRALAPEGAGMLVLDPLRDLHTEDENDSSAMSRVTAALRGLRKVLGCPVVFIHHMSKGPADGRPSRRAGQQMRGSTVLHATLDAGLYLRHGKGGDGHGSWALSVESETRSGRSAGRFSLRLEIEDDAQREAVRASWIHSRDEPDEADATMKAILDVLRDAEEPLSANAVAKAAGLGSHHTATKRLVKAEQADLARRTEDDRWVATPLR